MIIERAPAKVNLYLHVMGKRGDGYHDLDSLVAFTDFGDVVRVELDATFSVHVTGRFAQELGEDNLVKTAAILLAKHLGKDLTCKITLEKNLPVAAGIGGGSTDAAATLRALLRFFQADISAEDLQAIALELGADVPVCLRGRPALMRGIGDDITHIFLPQDIPVVLVNPLISCSTADVFRGFELDTSRSGLVDFDGANTYSALIYLLKETENDLRQSAVNAVPKISECIDALEKSGADFVQMSGSGATCFGLYPSHDKALEAAKNIAQNYPDYWVQSGVLNSGAHKVSEQCLV